ncbi:MAG: hypothetical protein H7099_04930 [Gemmatimonadaceae bacterium]|nr:hypothetical protein [Gemmatimonadaceae bacterium]
MMMHASTRVLAIVGLCAGVAMPLVAQQVVARAEPVPVNGRTAPATQAARDSIARKEQLSYRRETFAYDAGGRRDPFVSLAATGVLRPTIADLSLVGIAYATRNGASGVSSIAIFRDRQTKEQYRVRVGQPLGRMRVASIEPRRVVFAIDEFGISRQESIAMGDSTRTITPTRAP